MARRKRRTAAKRAQRESAVGVHVASPPLMPSRDLVRERRAQLALALQRMKRR